MCFMCVCVDIYGMCVRVCVGYARVCALYGIYVACCVCVCKVCGGLCICVVHVVSVDNYVWYMFTGKVVCVVSGVWRRQRLAKFPSSAV